MTALLREELLEYSLLQKLREALPEYGLVLATNLNPLEPANANVQLREAFPTPDERLQPLTISTVAFGFNFDDGGREVELGSTLTEYLHTIEAWIFATEPRLGRHIAHAIKHIVRKNDDEVPLLDFTQEGNPRIDSMLVRKSQARHQTNNSPRPWDQFVWAVGMQVQDIAYP